MEYVEEDGLEAWEFTLEGFSVSFLLLFRSTLSQCFILNFHPHQFWSYNIKNALTSFEVKIAKQLQSLLLHGGFPCSLFMSSHFNLEAWDKKHMEEKPILYNRCVTCLTSLCTNYLSSLTTHMKGCHKSRQCWLLFHAESFLIFMKSVCPLLLTSVQLSLEGSVYMRT